jgi:hypothetical protein
MADSAYASDDGTAIYCTSVPVAAVAATVRPPTVGVPAYNKWDNGVDAINAALAIHGFTVFPGPVVRSYLVTTPATKTAPEVREVKIDETIGTYTKTNNLPDRFTPRPNATVLHQLLNAAAAIGSSAAAIGSSATTTKEINITPVQYALFGLRHRDLAAADGEIASGSLDVTATGSTDKIPATFVIYNPSVKARTIVIVITVGGVKITITVRW